MKFKIGSIRIILIYFIHLAAIVPIKEVKNHKKAFKVNVNGTKNLINSLLKKKINQMVFIHHHLMFIS